MANLIISSTQETLSEALFNKIRKDISEKKQVLLVVPAQSTMSVEKEALFKLGKEGFFELNIIRGRKLAEIILSETKRPGKTAVDTLGRSMLLRSIAAKKDGELSTFTKISKNSEFLELVSSFISDSKKNNIDEAALAEITTKAGSPILKNKLADMQLFFGEYEKLMAGKFTDADDLVRFTAAEAKNSKTIKAARIYYYGFYSFTKREIEFLSALDEASLGLTITLLYGREPHFAVTRSTLKKLQSGLKSSVIETVDCSDAPLCALPCENVRLIRCTNAYTQSLTIAADIKKKVREGKLEYQDVAVLTGESEEMSGSLKRIFKETGIPFFADEKRSIVHTGAIDAVKSLLLLASENYKTLDAIRFIKSGVLDFDFDYIQRFENYVKLYHIKGEKFAAPFKYGKNTLGDEVFARLDEMRRIFYESTSAFTNEFLKSETVKEKALCLYKYLAGLKLPNRLDCLGDVQEKAGLLDASEESRQIWDSLLNLLDQMVELLGEEKLSNEEFLDLFNASLSQIKLGLLPQAEGKLCLGTARRSQIGKVKALYLVGLNDDILPSKNDVQGILTASEIDAVKNLGFTLTKDSDCLLEEEMFSIYKSVSSAENFLTCTYCTGSLGGSDLKPSELVKEILNLYPDIETEDDVITSGDDLALIEGKDFAKQHMASALRGAIEGEALSPVIKETYNLLKDEAEDIKAGLTYKSSRKPLGKEIAEKLFSGENGFSFSPSRLNNFASCPFKHFVSYGLRPLEEKEFGMNASEIGSVHHEALLKLCSKLSKASKDGGFAITDERSTWMNVTEDELEKMLDEILTELEANFEGGVMTSSKANEYTSLRTKRSCLKFAKHMVEEVRKSNIEDMFFEEGFVRGGVFPAITIDTSAGKVYVEGRIDRVDVCPKGDSKYVRVIDYKSGTIKFNKDLVSQGLELQLMVYLESALQNYPKDSDGGVYYFHIKDVPAGATLEDFPKEELAEEVIKKIEKEYKLDGMDVDEEFKANFSEKLKDLCVKITSGNIDVDPKKYKSLYNSCTYCDYASICNKDILD